MVYYLLGVVSTIAVGIFIWTIRRGKAGSADSLKKRVSANNTDTGYGLNELRKLNEETAKINRRSEDNNTEAGRTATEGLKSIEDTKRSVSDIIAASRRDDKKKP